MCDPVTAGAMAVSAAGSYLQQREQAKSLKAQQAAKEAAFRQGIAKQNAFAGQARQAFTPQVEKQGAAGFNQALTDNVSRRLQAFSDNKVNSGDYSVTPASAPKNVVMAQNKAFAETGAETDRDNRGLARVGGYGGTIFNQNLDRNQYARDFSGIADQAGGQSRLLPLEMNAAYNNAAKGGSFLPALLKYGGQAAGMYSAAGMPGYYGSVQGAPPGTLPWNVPGGQYQPGIFDYYKQAGF